MTFGMGEKEKPPLKETNIVGQRISEGGGGKKREENTKVRKRKRTLLLLADELVSFFIFLFSVKEMKKMRNKKRETSRPEGK